MSDLQRNKVNSDAIMAACNGKKPDQIKGLVGFDREGGTPNQKLQEAALLLWRYGVHGGTEAEQTRAMERCRELLDSQDHHGHGQIAGANEFFSPSHAPITYIAMAFMASVAHQLGLQLLKRVVQWWARELYLCDLHLVPMGPLADSVVGVGARFNISWNATRDECARLLRGATLSDHDATSARKYRDTFAVIILADLTAPGEPLHRLRPERPVRLPVKLEVCRYTGGHVSRVTAGELQKGDPTEVWVTYWNGALGDNRRGEVAPEFRGPVERVSL